VTTISNKPPEHTSQAYEKPGWQRYAWSYLANVLLVGTSFLSYHLCSKLFGKTDFELFVVAKRVMAYGLAVTGGGWSVSLAYHVAQARSLKKFSGSAYLSLAVQQVSLLCGCVMLATFVFPKELSFLLFGKTHYAYLTLPLGMEFLAISLQLSLTQFFLGNMQVDRSSVVTILCSTVFPLSAFFLFPHSLVPYLYGRSALTLATCLGLYFLLRRRDKVSPTSLSFGSKQGREYVRYALSRVPGTILAAAILGLPVTLAAYTNQNLEKAAALSIGVALINLVATGVTPLSALYLPQAAFMKARGAASRLRPWVVRICVLVGCSALVYVMLLNSFLEGFITLLLGRELTGFEAVIRASLPAAIPYAYFRCFQGFLDGAQRKPLATINASVSLAVFAGASWFSYTMKMGDPSVVGLVSAVSCLGVLTVLQTFWLLQPSQVQDGTT
jgi:O-antigen/teichoic acid export membrane protein